MHTREQMTDLLQQDKEQKKLGKNNSGTKVFHFILICTALTYYLPFYCSFLITITLHKFIFPYLEKKKKQLIADAWKAIKEQEHSLKN